MRYKSVSWQNSKLRLLDQTLLPKTIEFIDCSNHYQVALAIKHLQVRGAPAIGIAAAYGMVLATKNLIKSNGKDISCWEDVLEFMTNAASELNTRPTAVNLKYCTDRILNKVKNIAIKSKELDDKFCQDLLYDFVLVTAHEIYEEDKKSCQAIAKYGDSLIENGMQILTYCNAGYLATSILGTALAPLYLAHEKGKKFNVYCCETRPLFQGSRLTAWELQESGLNPTLICDNTAAVLMDKKRVDLIIVGADRIAKNGDTANKIGTYNLAVLAQYHHIPFVVAAPLTTFDFDCKNGKEIDIEIRHSDEVCYYKEEQIAPKDISCYSPAFDVTPHYLISKMITDKGIIQPVNEETLASACSWPCRKAQENLRK